MIPLLLWLVVTPRTLPKAVPTPGEEAGSSAVRNQDNTLSITETLLVIEAEWYYLQERYPETADSYGRLLNEYPTTIFRSPAIRRPAAATFARRYMT